MRFNINETVRVKLTDLGRAILKARHDELRALYPTIREHTPPKVDADGWSEFQAWELMQAFGSNMTMGCTLPFETTIEIGPRWRPASEPMPTDGFVLVEYSEEGDSIPEVWAAETYALALTHGDVPGWSHLFSQAKTLKRWLPLASLTEA